LQHQIQQLQQQHQQMQQQQFMNNTGGPLTSNNLPIPSLSPFNQNQAATQPFSAPIMGGNSSGPNLLQPNLFSTISALQLQQQQQQQQQNNNSLQNQQSNRI
jgi:hypothetical protein